MLALMITVVASPLTMPVSADVEDIEILETANNPANNHTYYLLSASSWTDAAEVARGLDGFLVTVNDAEEDQWLYDTFANNDSNVRHIWIGLTDQNEEGNFRWHDGTPFIYRNWGDGQPGEGDDEDFVHITGTNMGTIEPATWNDLEDDPQYFPVYGVVEVGEGADYALRFDGDDDQIVIPHDEELIITGSIHLSAWVMPYSLEGNQFIVMKGDYGWGMYISNGYIGYSSEYSLSQHPKSEVAIPLYEWSHIELVFVESIGSGYGSFGEFRINGEPAGNISADVSTIPQGDFGSNDCYESGESCDELYIGRMGAGCDCSYFEGLIDDVMIGTDISLNSTAESWISNWEFPEGESGTTIDHTGREGDIVGAAWVMPDGSIIAQAIELKSGESINGVSADGGDTLLFFADIPDNTRFLEFESYNYFMWNDDADYFDVEIEVLTAVGRIPSAWDYDHDLDTFSEFAWGYWEWPEEGVWWFTITTSTGFDNLEVYSYWEQAPEPPPLDEMTELINGIAITGQTIHRNSGDLLYFYANVTEPLSELKVKTFGGEGNCDLHIAWKVLPYDEYANGIYYGDFDETYPEGGELPKNDHSYGQGTNEMVHIFDADIGIYYIMMTSYRGCREVTIQADFAFAPDNIEPEDAIELQPGISFGPISGYNGLDQYFYIDIPTGTERIIVDLDHGGGEAKLMMRLEQYPTWTTYDKHSNAPGASDKIAFNDPTPGRWYILLGSEKAFSAVEITASFAGRYIWSYDGEPIELFNGEEVAGIEAPKGEEMFFFIDLGDTDAMSMQIQTWGGEGDVYLTAIADSIDWVDDWGEEVDGINGRQGSAGPGEQDSPSTEFNSNNDGPNQEIWIWMVSGTIDITLKAGSDISDIGILATWEEFDNPFPGPDPDPDPDPADIIPCDDYAEEVFKEVDRNGDGDVDISEVGDYYGAGSEEYDNFADMDLNRDGFIEVKEVKQEFCSCENEIEFVFEMSGKEEISLEKLSGMLWKNDYNFFAIDKDDDLKVDVDEVSEHIKMCTTIYDAFDRDGDGTPDDKDAFPDDASEDSDTDGDGVGDNADFAATVDNDIIYGSAAVVGVILVLVLAFLMAGTRREGEGDSWDKPEDSISERMLEMSAPNEEIISPPDLDLGPVTLPPESVTIQDLFD